MNKEKTLESLYEVALKVRLLRAWQNAHAPFAEEYSERERLALEFMAQFAPVTETELGRTFGLATSSASELVKKLMEKGAIELTERGTTDARQKPLALTTAGREVLKKIKAISAEQYEFLLSGLTTDAEWNSAAAVIELMQQAASKRLRQVFQKPDMTEAIGKRR